MCPLVSEERQILCEIIVKVMIILNMRKKKMKQKKRMNGGVWQSSTIISYKEEAIEVVG